MAQLPDVFGALDLHYDPKYLFLVLIVVLPHVLHCSFQDFRQDLLVELLHALLDLGIQDQHITGNITHRSIQKVVPASQAFIGVPELFVRLDQEHHAVGGTHYVEDLLLDQSFLEPLHIEEISQPQKLL